MKNRKKELATLFVLLAGSLWGCMGLFVRRMNAAGLFALETVQVRITLSALFVGVYLLLFHRELLRIRLKDLWCFIGTGVLSQLAFSWCYFTGMGVTSLSVMGVLLNTAPVFVMLISILLFKEKLNGRKVLALGLSFLGCCLVSGIGTEAQVPGRGLILGLLSGFTYALYSIFSRYAIQRGYSSWTITFYTFVTCGVGCAFMADWSLIGQVMSSSMDVVAWAVAMAFFTGFLAFILFTKGLEQMESSRAAILASVEPVVATIVGAVVFHEALTLISTLGIVLVLSAVVLLSRPTKNLSGAAQ